MSFESDVKEKYRFITEFLIEHSISICTMESCTSGLIASLITDTEGSSAVFSGSLVTYSNEAKILFGVPSDIIDHYGVYSAMTASFMAERCKKTFNAQIGIGITGSFGNVDPANKDSVPGSVYFAIDADRFKNSYHYMLPELASRYDYKIHAASLVAERLIEYLTQSK